MNTEIISCDSRQFFKELKIGTSPPSKKQLKEVNHHFIHNKSNREFMIEKKISSDEYTAAILNNKVLPIIKIVSSNEFYDF